MASHRLVAEYERMRWGVPIDVSGSQSVPVSGWLVRLCTWRKVLTKRNPGWPCCGANTT